MTDTNSFDQQAAVFSKSLSIFLDRSLVRGDLWTQSTVQDHVTAVKEKVARIEQAFKMIQQSASLGPMNPEVWDKAMAAMVDDAQDAINFLAFFVRQLTGEVPHTAYSAQAAARAGMSERKWLEEQLKWCQDGQEGEPFRKRLAELDQKE